LDVQGNYQVQSFFDSFLPNAYWTKKHSLFRIINVAPDSTAKLIQQPVDQPLFEWIGYMISSDWGVAEIKDDTSFDVAIDDQTLDLVKIRFDDYSPSSAYTIFVFTSETIIPSVTETHAVIVYDRPYNSAFSLHSNFVLQILSFIFLIGFFNKKI